MNTTEEMIKIMQAFVDGKTIECRDPNGTSTWKTVTHPLWNWFYVDYRIKPEPREFWLLGGVVHTSEVMAQCYRSANKVDGEIIHVREVL